MTDFSVVEPYTVDGVERRVRARADAHGLSIKELFERVDVSYGAWWRWRNGRVSPSIRIVQRLLTTPLEAMTNGTRSGVRLRGGR